MKELHFHALQMDAGVAETVLNPNFQDQLTNFEDAASKFDVQFSFDLNLERQQQEFRREGWTETAIIVCKLNKSL